jgi:hypothetical protein
MNTNMASARYALPVNSHAHLQHVHDQQTKQEAETTSDSLAAAAASSSSPDVEPRVSTGAKLTRKMQSMFGGEKEQRLARADQAEAAATEERKQSLLRRLAGDGVMMHSHRTHLGRP